MDGGGKAQIGKNLTCVQRGEETDGGGKAQVGKNLTCAQKGEEMEEGGKPGEVTGNATMRI